MLLICTCLPLGSCQEKKVISANETNVSSNGTILEKHKKTSGYLIPVVIIKVSDPNSWILFLSLIWPIVFLLTGRTIFKSVLKKRITGIISIILSPFSVYVIYSMVFKLWYEPMIWGYIAIILMAIYGLLNLYEILKFFFYTG